MPVSRPAPTTDVSFKKEKIVETHPPKYATIKLEEIQEIPGIRLHDKWW
ncbi:hypothetical protein HanXRQr2_Chr08g0343291 [Helianthus annuus]|uniref:Uncharacterized protein n=1 Tax=Helianthus annuus TaxID=4232 RepID=A0A9K3IFD1_HELAN|nr:hypothetical protein HanXRQr2_Chr08g0343291 [Helianthus annuus]